MIVEIDLPPDRCPAAFNDRTREWTCPLPEALPVLEYFTEKALAKMDPDEPNVAEYVGKFIVASIAGAIFFRIGYEGQF